MAKACRVLRSSKAPQAPRAAKVAKKKQKAKAGPVAASPKSKVHHRAHKKLAHKKKHHNRKVCGAAPGPIPVAH